MKGYRKMTIMGMPFLYKIGKQHINIRSGGKKLWCPSIAEVMGMTPDQVDRGKWKKWLHITPAYVSMYILGKLSVRTNPFENRPQVIRL